MFQQFEKYFFIIKESKHEAEHSTSYFTANTTDIRLFWTVFWHAFIIEVLDYYFDGINFNHYSAGLLNVAWKRGGEITFWKKVRANCAPIVPIANRVNHVYKLELKGSFKSISY